MPDPDSPVSFSAPAPKAQRHTPTEPDAAVLAEYMRLVDAARSRT
ncbi:MAG TPA: hypothetical protein VM009_06600 [Terriglobales bacterium]|nr:hypothetical protein [Terriglobales bacterium]